MPKHYFTEKQFKDALQINSCRQISKAKLMKFVSLIPNMDKDAGWLLLGSSLHSRNVRRLWLQSLKIGTGIS